MFSKVKLLCMELTIKQIASRAGGVVELSRKLGLSRGAVSQWEVVPLNRVRAVSDLTGIPREELRPDVFGIDQENTGSELTVAQPSTTPEVAQCPCTKKEIF